MKIKNRKVGYYRIVIMKDGSEHFNENDFICFLDSFSKTEVIDKQMDFKDREKAVNLENIVKNDDTDANGKITHYYNLTLKSCRYGFSPVYMSKNDGSERPSDKKMTEGDKDLTHVCIKVCPDCAYVAMEQNRFGVTFPMFHDYMNDFFVSKGFDGTLEMSVVLAGDISKIIEKVSRIMEMDVEYDYVRFAGINESCEPENKDPFCVLLANEKQMKTTLSLGITSNRGKSLSKELAKKTHFWARKKANGINRVRIKAKNNEGMDLMIDSDLDCVKDSINVELDDKGCVVSTDALKKIKELLKNASFV